MFDLPSFTGGISIAEGMAAVLLAVFGLVTHEALHLAAARYHGIETDVSLLKGDSKLAAFLFGGLVTIEFAGDPTRRAVASASLAPLLGAVFPFAAYAYALSYSVIDIGSFVAICAWFATSIPSLTDWHTALRYRPDTPSTEVITHG